MVGNITSLTNNGLRDWLVQRVTAVVLALYTFFLIGFFSMHPVVTYAIWQQLFANTCVRIFTLVALLSLFMHAWIGVWTVTTDYLSCVAVRLCVQVVVILALLSFLIWGIVILWGI